MALDPDFDYWMDLNPGMTIWEGKGAKDPDVRSKRLQAAHMALWTKPLPDGRVMSLTPAHGCQVQWMNFRLSSDCFGNEYSSVRRMDLIRRQAPEEAERIFRGGSKIGAYLMFPGYQVGGKMTINGARGTNARIADRIDLTLECIRRYYLGETSPLAEVLDRYSDFFELFRDFRGYIDFWLLQDLVTSHYDVLQLLPFDGFQRNGYPVDTDEYATFCRALGRCLDSRNHRIATSRQAREFGYPSDASSSQQMRLL